MRIDPGTAARMEKGGDIIPAHRDSGGRIGRRLKRECENLPASGRCRLDGPSRLDRVGDLGVAGNPQPGPAAVAPCPFSDLQHPDRNALLALPINPGRAMA